VTAYMSDKAVERVTAPATPVSTAVVAALTSGSLFAVNQFLLTAVSVPLLVIGYILGAILTIVSACVYRALRNVRRSDPRFRPQPILDRAAVLAIGFGMAAGLANAVLLAIELAKL
jgi:hypothetical protein